MSFLNYTNRINVICNDEKKSDVTIFVSSLSNKYFVFQENLERIKLESKKNFPEINFSNIKIFIEAYRDAYRKEVQWGNLESPVTDKIDFFKKKVYEAGDIDRNLDEIDYSTVRFRVIMISDEKNIATSEGFRPYVCKTKDDIVKREKYRKSSLIGIQEEDMEELFCTGFHNEAPRQGQPIIYVNKKLELKSDLSADSRIRSLVFSTSLKELVAKSLLDPSNKYKARLLEYAESFNGDTKYTDLIENNLEDPSDIYENHQIQEFINNAVVGYISDYNFFSKYKEEQLRHGNGQHLDDRDDYEN